MIETLFSPLYKLTEYSLISSLILWFLSFFLLILLPQQRISFLHTSLFAMFSFTAVKYLHRMFLSFTHCSLHVCSVQLNQGTARQENTEPGGGRGAKRACMRGAVFVQTCQLFCFFVLWTYLGLAEHQLKGTKKMTVQFVFSHTASKCYF